MHTYDLQASDAASYTLAAMWLLPLRAGLGPKRTDPLHTPISEEAQQDMDLKSAFAQTVPRQPSIDCCLVIPNRALVE